MRLFSFKPKPFSSKYFRGFTRSAIDLDGWQKRDSWICSLALVNEYQNSDDDKWNLTPDNITIGIQGVFMLGYSKIYYDGNHHRLSFGPFYLCWYTW